MKKNLNALTDYTLYKIAADYSVDGNRAEVVAALCETFKSYNLKWSDLVSRYGIGDTDLIAVVGNIARRA